MGYSHEQAPAIRGEGLVTNGNQITIDTQTCSVHIKKDDNVPDQQFFEREAFSQLASMEEGHFWFEERNQLLEWCVRRFFPKCASFCEVGCGTGFVVKHLEAEFSKIGFTAAEFFIEALHFATRRTVRCRFLQTDARALPFKAVFDVLGAFDVIEHIEEDELVLKQFHRSLKPGGGLIITVPQHMFLWSTTDEVAHHKRRYSRSELKGKVERAGFHPLFCTSFVTSLLPMMLASRWMSRKRHRRGSRVEGREQESPEEQCPQDDSRCSSNREFNLPSPINGLFRVALSFERLLIRTGVSLPVGGSLVLVAMKKEK